ncbi:MAG: hypothetical protein VKS61_04775 [Candidatus Sericytochromatia bacterium]|nr:hypothetical protein [Candidatus Sericytochromatia bacterium]MEB3221372.1 hypothetical protein [Candidatus Sericytochromatia bacterium]
MSEDRAQRQGDQLQLNTTKPLPGTGRLPQPPASGPLARPGTAPLVDEAVFKASLETTVARVSKHVQALEQRMELLVHSLQAVQMPIPGVEAWTHKHALSPQGKKIIAYLEKIAVMKPDLARQMQVAVFRFHDAAQAVTGARRAMREGRAGPQTLEEVKRKFYPLTILHLEFRHDHLLGQMFPPPEEPRQRAPGTGALQARGTGVLNPQDSATRYAAMRQATWQRGEAVIQHLAPGMAEVRRLLELQRPVVGTGLLDIFNPQSKRARLLAARLKDDPRATQHAETALRIFGELKEAVLEVKKGAKPEPLAEQLEYLATMLGVWHQHPVLKDFFPALNRQLFFPPR